MSRKRTLLFVVLALLFAFGLAACRFPYKREAKTPHPAAAPRIEEGAKIAPPQVRATEGYSDVCEKAVKSVVNISSTKILHNRPQELSPLFSDPFFRRFFGEPRGGMPRERPERALGSGVIVSKDGYILTNNHVVSDADEVLVVTSDGRELKAKIIGADEKSDVAVLKVPADNLEPMPLGDSAKLRLGEVVLAIGNPFGLSGTVTMGIVSAVGRANVGITDYEDFIQTDAAINPGNSGGALINTRGELVGINTAIFSQSGGSVGVGFAIPMDMARSVMDSLVKYGRVERGFLGVSIQDVRPDMAAALGLANPGGALVGDVTKDSPAKEAGFERGDVVVKFNGKDVHDASHFRNLVSETPPGTKAEVVVIRDKKEKTLTVTVGHQAGEKTAAGGEPGNHEEKEEADASVGMTVSNLTPELRRRLEISADVAGIVVTRVQPGSRAAEAGLRSGAVILEANREAVHNVADFKRLVGHAPEGKVLLLVSYNGSTSFVLLRTK
jgi:serine protease Do